MKSVYLFVFSIAALFVVSCQKGVPVPPSTQIALVNPGFEEKLTAWNIETAYVGRYGFSSDTAARIKGDYGLNFYAAQKTHWEGAPQETPWNGKIYQTISNLKDGTYIYKALADAVGTGMYLWANGSSEQGDVKLKIKSDINELNTLEFQVKGGTAKIGFICIDAGGDQLYAPYFHADEIELWKK
jgi:hypothetical protein